MIFKLSYQKLTRIFYALTGITASFTLLLISYYVLRLDSNLAILITHNTPLYVFTYLGLTIVTAILFGINFALLVYKIRAFGMSNLFSQMGSGAGAMVGIFSSACSICGSTLLSLIGVTGGLASFPFNGIELKILAFVLTLVPVLILIKEIKSPSVNANGVCLIPKDDKIKSSEVYLLAVNLIALTAILVFGFSLIKTDDIATRDLPLKASYNTCPNAGKRS